MMYFVKDVGYRYIILQISVYIPNREIWHRRSHVYIVVPVVFKKNI